MSMLLRILQILMCCAVYQETLSTRIFFFYFTIIRHDFVLGSSCINKCCTLAAVDIYKDNNDVARYSSMQTCVLRHSKAL